MSGLFDRLVGQPPAYADRVKVHRITSGCRTTSEGFKTLQELLDHINSGLQTPLDAEAEADITQIVTSFDNLKGKKGDRAEYEGLVEGLNLDVQTGWIGADQEDDWRQALGLPPYPASS